MDKYSLIMQVEHLWEAKHTDRDVLLWLENLVNEEDWREVRACLGVISDESGMSHFSEAERRMLLSYLRMLIQSDNRVICTLSARTAGYVLADLEETGGQNWKGFLHPILFPGNRISRQQKRRMGYVLKELFTAFFERADETHQRLFVQQYGTYFKSTRWDEEACLALLSSIFDIPYKKWTNLQRHNIFGYFRSFRGQQKEEIQVSALWVICNWVNEGWKPQEDMQIYLASLSENVFQASSLRCERYLNDKVSDYFVRMLGKQGIRALPGMKTLDAESQNGENRQGCALRSLDYRELVQENLRADMFWIGKVINLHLLKEMALAGVKNENIQKLRGILFGQTAEPMDFEEYASHLLHVLRLNNQEAVFTKAGEDLLEIMPYLSEDKKEEIVQDVLKSIELNDDSLNYIPSFLGRAFVLLDEKRQRLFFETFKSLFDSHNPNIVKVTMEVLAVSARQLLQSRASGQVIPEETLAYCAGLLNQGVVNYRTEISKEARYLVQSSFGEAGREMDLFDTLDQEEKQSESLEKKAVPRKIAFFRGNFDPFTMGHRAIVKEIVDMGYTVYLATQDFDWEMVTQSAVLRRKMMQMTVADIPHVHLFPADLPVNLDNEADLRSLKEYFGGQTIWLVLNSKRIFQYNGYWNSDSELLTFPHIIYSGQDSHEQEDIRVWEQQFHSEVIQLKLPSYIRERTSELVKKMILEKRDFSSMVEKQVERMIVEYHLYSDLPVYKKEPNVKPIETEILQFYQEEDAFVEAAERKENPEIVSTAVLLRDASHAEEDVACALYEDVNYSNLFLACESLELASALRKHISGKIALITEIKGITATYRRTVLNELIVHIQEQEYSYVFCLEGKRYGKLLLECGFCALDGYEDVYILDVRNPLTIFYDIKSYIKEPYGKVPEVEETIERCRRRMSQAIVGLYPGNAVLNLETEILNYRMIGLLQKKKDKICVPFGKMLKGALIPEVITKELYTEKLYRSDLSSFEIREFPSYPSLQTQIRTIKSFGRPAVLVDDLYHKGYRMGKIKKMLDEEQVELSQVVTGVISGRGHDLALMSGIDVEAVYQVPNMRSWMLESDLYPFIGGDGIESINQGGSFRQLLPSINHLLPYEMPSFLAGASLGAVYNLSMTCMENARDIFLVLEKVYQERRHRMLTLSLISEVMAEPRFPDGVVNEKSDGDQCISALMEQEIARLRRLRYLA